MELVSKIIDILGLTLGFIGGFILFLNSWPKGLKRSNVAFMYSESVDMAQAERNRIHDRNSRIGFGLVGLGFILQISVALAGFNESKNVSFQNQCNKCAKK